MGDGKAGGRVDKTHPTQVGRAFRARHHPHRLLFARGAGADGAAVRDAAGQELRLAGITAMEAANRWLAEDFLPRFNARFAVRAAEPGSAFMAYVGWPLEDILCIQEEPKERLDARLYPCYLTEDKRHADGTMSRSFLALVTLLLSLASNVNAAEPAVLADAQMDEVTAGATRIHLSKIAEASKQILKAQKLIIEARQQTGQLTGEKLIQARRHILEAQARLKPIRTLPDAYSVVELYQAVKNDYYNTRVNVKLQTVAKIGSSRVALGAGPE